jgi:hypothetical protein
MKLEKILKICLIFLFGFLSANLISYYIVNGLENPFSNGFNLSQDKFAPDNFINESQIQIYDDKVVINVKGASLSRYAATGSMKPTFDENANGIRIVPKTADEINVGDIITFEQDGNLIVHRVIEKGNDSKGVYFITKGDNNTVNDGKIRFSDIKYITIAMIW